MTENKRFMVDDAGTLIDMVTRDTFDYVSDVVGLLNNLVDENEQLKKENQEVKDILNELKSINCYWDSALLQGYIDKIANVFGVDLE